MGTRGDTSKIAAATSSSSRIDEYVKTAAVLASTTMSKETREEEDDDGDEGAIPSESSSTPTEYQSPTSSTRNAFSAAPAANGSDLHISSACPDSVSRRAVCGSSPPATNASPPTDSIRARCVACVAIVTSFAHSWSSSKPRASSRVLRSSAPSLTPIATIRMRAAGALASQIALCFGTLEGRIFLGAVACCSELGTTWI